MPDVMGGLMPHQSDALEARGCNQPLEGETFASLSNDLEFPSGMGIGESLEYANQLVDLFFGCKAPNGQDDLWSSAVEDGRDAIAFCCARRWIDPQGVRNYQRFQAGEIRARPLLLHARLDDQQGRPGVG